MSEHTIIDGINYGPLAALVGTWEGDKGIDRAPEPEGEERNPYYETIVFEAAGDVTNAEQQILSVVRYTGYGIPPITPSWRPLLSPAVWRW